MYLEIVLGSRRGSRAAHLKYVLKWPSLPMMHDSPGSNGLAFSMS